MEFASNGCEECLPSWRVKIRTISLAMKYGWSLHRMDVKNVFLHRELNKKVHMEQLPEDEKGDPHAWVCKVRNFIYGLKKISCS